MAQINYIALSALSLLFACSLDQANDSLLYSNNENDNLSSRQENIAFLLEPQTEALDTINIIIGQPQIVAFAITKNEYNKLSVDAASEYDEGYGDLIFYLEEFSKKVRGSHLLITQTASRFIKIGNSLIDRNALGSAYGLIFITKDGKYEIVCDGLLDSEILDKSKSMFPPLIER